ncbi:hypothetical protein JYT15_00435, partial [Acidimicrobium ferrooxidans]|nr:hypothetical protein [Acidimicrobium ferrooxidans]
GNLGFNASQIHFISRANLVTALKWNPGVAFHHLPRVRERNDGVCTLDQLRQAERDQGFLTPWVGFGGRDDVVTLISTHLRSKEPGNVVHIAGLSGIGKTRTALEACRGEPALAQTFYAKAPVARGTPWLHHLLNTDANATVILDELGLDELPEFIALVSPMSERVRFVTVGPAPRHSKRPGSPEVHVLVEPDRETGIYEVISRVAGDLEELVLQSISRLSAHDLRLALLLVKASKLSPELASTPIEDSEDVWQRILALFHDRLSACPDFEQSYERLTSSVDIGRGGSVRDEIEHLGSFYGEAVSRLDAASIAADDCGLGKLSNVFFEAEPRALADWIFKVRLLPALRPRLKKFLIDAPERLVRGFMSRLDDADLEEELKEELREEVASFFVQERLSDQGLLNLVDRDKSRSFKLWVELDPERGLRWLERAVSEASAEDLARLDGEPDGSGGWRGRRQIVWLCEGLASFQEHFFRCESILFRLAQVETEPSVHNNSRGIWSAMFQPILANTEVPYEVRVELLCRRVRRSDRDTLPLLLGAATSMLKQSVGGRMVPPAVVGGRVVPPQWQPGTFGELDAARREAGARLIDVLDELHADLGPIAVSWLIERFGGFARSGLVDAFRGFYERQPVDDEARAKLTLAIDRQIGWFDRCRDPSRHSAAMEAIRQWRTELAGTTLADRVRELTAPFFWDHEDSERTEGATETLYRKVALELEADTEVLSGLDAWFDSRDCQSAAELGKALGLQTGPSSPALEVLRCWVLEGKCRSFVIGYLRGQAVQNDGVLPEVLASTLAEIPNSTGLWAVDAVLLTDVAPRGWRLVQSKLADLGLDHPSLPLRRMRYPWAEVLEDQQLVEVVECLLELDAGGDSQALGVALDLAAGWFRRAPELATQALNHVVQLVLEKIIARDEGYAEHDWASVMDVVAQHSPDVAARLAARVLGGCESAVSLYRSAVGNLIKLAESYPQLVMDSVGQQLLLKERAVYFCLFEYRGLFEAIGLDAVRDWLAANGPDNARYMSRHIQSPYLNAEGVGHVPPLTAWILDEFQDDEDVFREFLIGRHSGEVRVGHSRDRTQDVQDLVAAFSNHDLRRVREWAEHEREELERDIEREDHWDEMRERE